MSKDQDLQVLDDKPHHAPRDEGCMTQNSDGTKTVLLQYPVLITTTIAGGATREEKISELIFRRPNGGDMRAIMKFTDPFQQAVIAFSRLSGQPEMVFDRLDISDITLVSEVIESFLSKSPQTGKI